jgi:HlyD family secretion protein
VKRVAAVLLVLLLVALTPVAWNGGEKPERYQGWVEADLLFVGPDLPGRVEALSVREGDTVTAGAELFALDTELQQTEVQSASAALANARQAYERAQALVRTAAGTQRAVDDAKAALIDAEARLNAAQTRLKRRYVASPADGTVQQVYFRPGEMVPSGRAVLALLPPGNLKIRFFVPQAQLPSFAPGDRVQVQCDGCAPDIVARVDFIARTAEYTPPVIYSLEERNKLVFLVEARPERPDNLRVGQPISVTRAAPERAP